MCESSHLPPNGDAMTRPSHVVATLDRVSNVYQQLLLVRRTSRQSRRHSFLHPVHLLLEYDNREGRYYKVEPRLKEDPLRKYWVSKPVLVTLLTGPIDEQLS